jgi:O-antigen/teichoic acid export membrane protein
VIIKIATGLVTSKLLAIFVGPSGMALVGNLRNFMTTLESLSTLGFQNGIVKYVTENQEKKSELNKIISTVFISITIVTFILSLGIFLFAEYFNNQIFGNSLQYKIVFKALAIALPWYAFSIIILSIINGFGKFKNVILINIAGNLIGLLVSILLIFNFNTLGALLSIVLSPALLLLVTFYYIEQEIKILKIISFKNFDFSIIKNLFSYSLMALVSAIFCPIIYLAIRQKIIFKIGIDQAGFYETISRISSYYLLFVTTILTIYYLPKLIKAQNNFDTKMVFYDYYKYILSVFIIGTIIIYFSRFFIINLLFTKDFQPVNDLFFWQLIGDIFKVASFILAFNFFAKKLTKAFILTEIVSLIILYLLSIYFLNQYGIQGIVIAYAIENIIYFIALSIYFRKSLF